MEGLSRFNKHINRLVLASHYQFADRQDSEIIRSHLKLKMISATTTYNKTLSEEENVNYFDSPYATYIITYGPPPI